MVVVQNQTSNSYTYGTSTHARQYYGVSETLKKDLARLLTHKLFAQCTRESSALFCEALAQLEEGNFFSRCPDVNLITKITEQISTRKDLKPMTISVQ